MSATAEKRIRLIAFDVAFGTPARDLDLPVNDVWPGGCSILWTCWNFRNNCLIAAVYHPQFPEVEPFSTLDAIPSPLSW